MNKWFESKNLANYAKTALLQAQKKIDQVLDIKEDEIIANTLPNDTPSVNLGEQTSQLKKSSSNSSLASTSSKRGEPKKSDVADTDSFFSTFLSATSTTLDTLDITEPIKFDSFVNSNVSPTPPSKPAKTNANKRGAKISSKTNNVNITSSKTSSDAEKQTWIQNYVDSSPTQTTSLHEASIAMNLSADIVNQQQEANSNSNFMTTSSLLVSSSISSTSTANAALVLLSTSSSSSTSTATNSVGFSLTNNDTISEAVNEEEAGVVESMAPQTNADENTLDVTSVVVEPIFERDQAVKTMEDDVEKVDVEQFVEEASENANNIKSFTESLDYVSWTKTSIYIYNPEFGF